MKKSLEPFNNRFFCLEAPIALFLENIGFYYAGCDFAIEPGKVYLIELYLDWQIQSEPYFAVTHTPTGHCWMPWNDAPEDVEFIEKIIRAGTQVQLTKSLEIEE